MNNIVEFLICYYAFWAIYGFLSFVQDGYNHETNNPSPMPPKCRYYKYITCPTIVFSSIVLYFLARNVCENAQTLSCAIFTVTIALTDIIGGFIFEIRDKQQKWKLGEDNKYHYHFDLIE